MSPLTTIILTSLAAFFFMAASWVMKTLGQTQVMASLPLVFLLLGLGAWVEIEVLRATRLGHVMAIMLAIELLMTFAVAWLILGERYTAQEFAGVAVIIFGIVVLSVGKQQHENLSTERAPAQKAIIIPRQISMPIGAAFVSSQAFKTSTPGSTFPSIHSRNAPPAVET